MFAFYSTVCYNYEHMYEYATTSGKGGQISLRFATFAELAETVGQQETAQVIAAMVNTKGEHDAPMLEVSPADIQAKHLGVVALRMSSDTDKADMPKTPEDLATSLVGFAGVLDPVDHGGKRMAEVGSLKVAEPYRNHGVGTALFRAAVTRAQLEGLDPYAFCNAHSLPIAQQIGGQPITSIDEVPAAAFALCAGCPAFEQVRHTSDDGNHIPCCDTVVVWNSHNNLAA